MVNLSHPARADRGEDFIGSKACVRLDRHSLLPTENGQSITPSGRSPGEAQRPKSVPIGRILGIWPSREKPVGENPGGLKGSMQHWLGVYPPEFEIPTFFVAVD